MRAGFFTFEDLGSSRSRQVGPGRCTRSRASCRAAPPGVSKERGLTALAGRGRELERLQSAFGHAASGQGRTMVVLGEPGVGKSRLLYEFLRGLDGVDRLELETTCASYGGSFPYRPSWNSSGSTSSCPLRPPNTRFARGPEGAHRLGLVATSAPSCLPSPGCSRASELLGRLSGAELKDRTHELLRDFFLGLSKVSPLLVIVENVHWADASSGAVLGDLATTLRLIASCSC